MSQPEKFTADEIRAMMLRASRAHPGDIERQRAHLDDQIRARFADLDERKAAAGEARGPSPDDVSRLVRKIGRQVPLYDGMTWGPLEGEQ